MLLQHRSMRNPYFGIKQVIFAKIEIFHRVIL